LLADPAPRSRGIKSEPSAVVARLIESEGQSLTIREIANLKKAGIQWKGWLACLSARLRNLLGQESMAATARRPRQGLLRHANSSTTEDHYIKNTKQERRTAQAQKVISIRRQRTVAAATTGAGLKQAAVN
jgi:hypothetical protein